MKRKLTQRELKRVNYEIFIVILTLLAVINAGIILFAPQGYIKEVALEVNLLLSVIFLFDFLYRFSSADDRKEYFMRQHGWLDLLGSVPNPVTTLARIMRLIRASRAMRKVGRRKLFHLVAENRADTAVLSIGLFVILLLEFGSIFILIAERSSPDAQIQTSRDALWWILVTISTVGYGDYVPVTSQGQFVAFFVILAGVGVFGTLSAFLAKVFLGQGARREQQQMQLAENLLKEIRELQLKQSTIIEAQENINETILGRLDALEKLLQENAQK